MFKHALIKGTYRNFKKNTISNASRYLKYELNIMKYTNKKE